MTTKIPAELSSTPGIADSSNATAITIDSSENVGIGTSSPNQLLHVHGGRVQVTRSNDINEFGFIEQDASGNAMGIFTNGGAIRFGANGTGTEHMEWY